MHNPFQVIQAIFGAIYILFLPGFAASYLFFAHGKIDAIERVALSLALSVAIVPLMTFYLSLVGVKIRFWTVFIEVFLVILISTIAAKFMGNLEKPHEHKKHS